MLEMRLEDSGALDLDELQRILDWARRQIYVVGWDGDRAEHHVAPGAYRALGQLYLAAGGRLPSNFRS